MTSLELFENIKHKRSFLCIGLDSDIKKIPKHLLEFEDPIFEFNKAIVDSTHDLVVSYKPNVAFYESMGSKGWQSLDKTVSYIKSVDPSIFIIADAKRGDIGNTSSLYARAFFETMNFDAVTVAPYMGEDSVVPFFTYKNKTVIILALTSNQGAFDFQFMEDKVNSDRLFEKVIRTSKAWGDEDNTMYVVGATKADMIGDIRKIIPNHFLLVPGVGTQGGSLEDVAHFGMNKQCGLLVNSSRAIIYADESPLFASAARIEAALVQQEMSHLLVDVL